VTTLLERMREELVRRNYAANTIHTYLRIILDFEAYTGKEVDADDLRRYHAHLLEERKLAARTVVQRVCAVRFLYCKTLTPGHERRSSLSQKVSTAASYHSECRGSDPASNRLLKRGRI
jgi:site-specific recombinase XerD